MTPTIRAFLDAIDLVRRKRSLAVALLAAVTERNAERDARAKDADRIVDLEAELADERTLCDTIGEGMQKAMRERAVLQAKLDHVMGRTMARRYDA